jgi:hypothetical protein
VQQCAGQQGKFSLRLRADLVKHAEHYFALARWESKKKGAKPASKTPVFPEAGRYLWNWFLDLSRRERAYAGMAGCPMPLRSQDITAWAEASGIRMTPVEIGTIRALDDIWMSVMTEPDDKAKGGEPPLTEDGDLDRDEVARRLDRALGMFG